MSVKNLQATQKLVAEFNYIRTNAVAPLSTFMDYITFVHSLSHQTALALMPVRLIAATRT